MEYDDIGRRGLAARVKLAEAELSDTGAFFMVAGDLAAPGRSVLAELRRRHPGCHIDGFQLTFKHVFAIWSDDRLRLRAANIG